jgi:hypothetical protein
MTSASTGIVFIPADPSSCDRTLYPWERPGTDTQTATVTKVSEGPRNREERRRLKRGK